MQTVNVMIVGVGGQGSLLASKTLGQLLLDQGLDVKVSEVHGMSQRGGSVVTYVRFGDKVYSPIIDEGRADYIVSFEQLEAARWISYLKPGGQVIVNTQDCRAHAGAYRCGQLSRTSGGKNAGVGSSGRRHRCIASGRAGRFL